MRKTILLAAVAAAIMPALANAQTPPAPAATAATAGKYTTEDTDIGTLMADPAAKAVLTKYIPDVVNDEGIAQAASMTLRAVQVYAPEKLPDEKLAKIDVDLAKLPVKK